MCLFFCYLLFSGRKICITELHAQFGMQVTDQIYYLQNTVFLLEAIICSQELEQSDWVLNAHTKQNHNNIPIILCRYKTKAYN